MNELFFDILPANGTSDNCTVVLSGYRDGACPTIRHISAERFLNKLHDLLLWPAETIERIQLDLANNGRAVNERLGWLSVGQLRQLGFVGL
jgi:hypothetical protein